MYYEGFFIRLILTIISSDLEYVVFDEVHYINDAERGVVWEEVLILLPNHVNIIMLSATVPNTLAFADWVGRTKKKKIYVISTMKRPVPLEHFLYTGSSAKSKDERFLLQDSNGNFLQEGYNKAYLAKKERENKGKAAYGAKCVKDRVGPQQEKNILITLIDHLSKRDKLPVVVFTLSRNRIDQNASLLTSMDLTTSMEKSDIHHFIRKCVQRLKGSDKKLPQVLQLTELLKRGIGIHHSGILPILKEVVEMLFQRGLVKLLFATETFAMGVNMPARTVVFDNIRKHDGKEFRTLLPAEYIQMAGRAGRRGLDSTGTVIILCKNELHQINELHGMMQGKPSMLESKFRLTYSMILNLLRVEQLRVEDMMKRSFMEINSQKKQSHYKERVEQLKKEVEGMPPLTGALFQELERFYTLAAEYTELKSGIWRLLLSHPVAAKALVPGRVLVVKHGSEINKYGILLAVDAKSRVKSYSVMVLSSGEEEKSSADKPQDDDDDFLRFVALAAGVSQSYGAANCDHVMVDLTDEDVFEIVDRTLKVDADKIFKDIKNREIPRFRGNPPAPSTMGAVQELIKLSDLSSADGGVGCFNLVKDFRVQDMDLLNKLERLEGLKTSISCLDCLSIPDFSDQFFKIHHSMKLRCELKNTEYLMSEESLTTCPTTTTGSPS
jgi:antiviral helicase SKI2